MAAAASAAAAESNRKRKRGKNWSSQETVLLIEAKQAVAAKEGMGMGGSTAPASAKWQAIADHLEAQGVLRDVEQCRSKWENMLGDYRSISEYERRNASPATSYFALSKEQKRDLKLPAKFPTEMYQLLATTGRGDAEMDVLPVVNAAAPFVSGDSFSSDEIGPGGGGGSGGGGGGGDTSTTPSLMQYREVGSHSAYPTAAPAPAAAATATNPTKRRYRSSSSLQGGGGGGGGGGEMEAVAKAICESHDRILAFLQEREERRSKMEERKLLLERQRMEADKEERLKLLEMLTSMAMSWRKLSEQMVYNRSGSA